MRNHSFSRSSFSSVPLLLFPFAPSPLHLPRTPPLPLCQSQGLAFFFLGNRLALLHLALILVALSQSWSYTKPWDQRDFHPLGRFSKYERREVGLLPATQNADPYGTPTFNLVYVLGLCSNSHRTHSDKSDFVLRLARY